jgi:hypothetical protein
MGSKPAFTAGRVSQFSSPLTHHYLNLTYEIGSCRGHSASLDRLCLCTEMSGRRPWRCAKFTDHVMGSKRAITSDSASASMKANFSNRADNIESAEQFVLLLASKKSSL